MTLEERAREKTNELLKTASSHVQDRLETILVHGRGMNDAKQEQDERLMELNETGCLEKQ